MLRIAFCLGVSLALAGCASSFSGRAASPGGSLGYAANDAAPDYARGRERSQTYASVPKPERGKKLAIPEEVASLSGVGLHRPERRKVRRMLPDDKLEPSQYMEIRGLGSRAGAGGKKAGTKFANIGRSRGGAARRVGRTRFDRVRLDAVKARDLINAYRRKKGLPPLSLSAKLTRAAMAHSRDLARFDRISHHGSDGSDPWDRVKRSGYRARLAAENVGTGQASLREVLRGWQNSPGHNANLLLKDATQMGIALVYDPKTEYRTFWTLVLGAPL